MTGTAPLRDSLARLHSVLGVLPLGVYLFFHVWEQWPALESRELWVDRARDVAWHPWALLVVAVPLLAHAGIGLSRFAHRARATASAGQGVPGLARLQAATGIVALAFIIVHVAQVYPLASGPHASPRDGYVALWQTLGQPVILAIYLVGITSVCFHFAHGLTLAADTWGQTRDARALRRTRVLAGVIGIVLWLAMLQLVARFALGEALVPDVARALRGIGMPSGTAP